MGKRISLVLLAIMAVACAFCAQAFASSATRSWETAVTTTANTRIPGQPAIDPSGNIYVYSNETGIGHIIRKLDGATGAIDPVYLGTAIERWDGWNRTLDPGSGKGLSLACDPLTGYIYFRKNATNICVVDPNTDGLPSNPNSTGLIVREFDDGAFLGWTYYLNFSPDGKLYAVGEAIAHATESKWIVREIPRTEARPLVAATLDTGTAPAGRIHWTAKHPGASGNSVTVTLAASPNHALVTTGGTNQRITWTAVNTGLDTNNITVELFVSGTNTPLSVSVVGQAITVNLATDGSGVATSMPADVVTAIANDAAASALVTASQVNTTPVALTAVAPTNLQTPRLTVAHPAVNGDLYTGSITVNLATDGGGNSVSTAAEVIAATIADHAYANMLLIPTAIGNDSLVVLPQALASLSGGGGENLDPPASDGNAANDLFDVSMGYMDYGCAAAKAVWNSATKVTDITSYGSLNSGPLRHYETIREQRMPAVDSEGHIYVGSNNAPQWRFNLRFVSGHPEDGPDMQWLTPFWSSDTICIDENDRLWTIDQPSSGDTPPSTLYVRCWKNGGEVLKFDPIAGSSMTKATKVEWDRVNHRLVVVGQSGSGASTAFYVQSWSVSIDEPATITGVVRNATTGEPIANAWVVAWPYDRWSWANRNVYDAELRPVSVRVDADGKYKLSKTNTTSWDLVADTADYTVQNWSWPPPQNPDYYGTRRHWEPVMGTSQADVDFPMLVKADTVEVLADLSTNPTLEQGLFLKGSPLVSSAGESWNGHTKFTAKGGRGCRVFGAEWPPVTSFPYMMMQFDVDSEFITSGGPCVVEADVFDTGYDRYLLQMDTTAAADTQLAVEYKSNTGTWKTLTWYRPDARCNDRLLMEGATRPGVPTISPNAAPAPNNKLDFRFGTMLNDSSAPVGPDYISRVSVRNSTSPTMYREIGSINDLKKLSAGGSYSWIGGQYGGGIPVKLTGKAVTSSWLDQSGKYVFYIEEADRSSGIRVMSDSVTPATGNVVTVAGSLRGIPETQELAIYADSVGITPGQTATITPLAMGNMPAGGEALALTRTIDGTTYSIVTQPGTRDGTGPANVGLLVRVFGKVTAVDPPWFFVDDGTHRAGFDSLTGSSAVGVNVANEYLWNWPSVGDYVSAEGVVTLGLNDPTPDDLGNGDEWRYPVIVGTADGLVKAY